MKLQLALVVLLVAVGTVAVVTRNDVPETQQEHALTLGDLVEAACKPGVVSDWHVDYTDESLLQVTCYFPKTHEIKSTVVER